MKRPKLMESLLNGEPRQRIAALLAVIFWFSAGAFCSATLIALIDPLLVFDLSGNPALVPVLAAILAALVAIKTHFV